MDTIVGIDLGTTNSVISVMQNNEIKVIPNAQGFITTPSIVAFTNQETLVGARAKNQAVTNPSKTISSVKRLMGLRMKDIEELLKNIPYKVSGKKEEPIKIQIDNKFYTPQEISAKILRELKKSAEDYLGIEIKEAVITVPAYFNDSQRKATKDAGLIAGFNVRRIINEPTSAALAFGFKETSEQESTIAVFDLGGGTFDISILEIGGGVTEVKSTNGDTFLGGDDFDQTIVDYLIEEFIKKYDVDLRRDLVAVQRLREAAEKAKCELSSSLISNINLPFIASKNKEPINFQCDLPRAKFEFLIKEHMRRIEKCCKQALSDAKLQPQQIKEVVLVGGSTRIPLVQDLVKKIFGREPNKTVNPDEVVSRGAAIQGAIMGGAETKMVLLDVTPLSLGIETVGEEMDVLIPRNTTIPYSIKEIYTTSEDDQDAVDVYVYQGERKKVKFNRLLGNFQLDGLLPAPAGIPQVEVTFDIDTNGILKVSAKDLTTGRQQRITVQNSSGLSQSEINRMKKEAQENEAEDQRQAEFQELVNNSEMIIQQTVQGIVEFSQKLSEEEVQKLDLTVQKIVTARESKNLEDLKVYVQELISQWQTLSTKISAS